MTPLRTTLVLIAGASLLAACGKGGQNAASSAAAGATGAQAANSAAAPASGPDVQITADQLPTPKIGLWETTTSTDGGPPEVSKNCETGKKLDTTKVAKDCQTFTIKRTFLGGYVIDASCHRGEAGSTVHMSIQGDFLGGSYTSDGTMTMTFQGRTKTFTTHSTAKYVGPCPPGQENDGDD